MTEVWAIDMLHTDKLVLLALADNANDEGSCWPSVATIATKCSLEQRSVSRAMERLEASGHLTRTERAGRSNTYIVHPRPLVTPDLKSPLTESQTPSDYKSSPPLTNGHPPPDYKSPITIIEPSVESKENREREARAPRSARATRLPEDFGLTPERRKVAETEKADPDREFAQFVDHFRSAPGEKGRKVDWDATWRNWCRRAPDFKPRPRFTTGHPEDTGWRPPEARR